ncbi:hypothetical protein BJY16_004828 [Actinoplanes octamycinicus]|uniref:non-specific serine/threonine protein kinase n=1 Tax=Actinoplanes octamycinicus TaxID=135948 RepID=A0A7W7GZW0_9ACTN|nr:serine/threonine-protein kinase [Actinoplanes octamycinicus]MBB4741369.1 hypothetical protein [Actinoplanes octamycinicus]GIE62833.1 serine/threonine protein kinase [Actinoplanes octamycinicus]
MAVDGTDDRVGGRYRLLEVVGSGGMGRVWRAEDDLLLRTVAVKEVAVPSAAPLVSEAMREARAAARLDHPGVVKVFDVVWRRGRCWIVMEYVPSRSLQQVIRDDGPLPVHQAARIGLRMLAALRAAHAAGVLHRDVKPDNVLLAADGRVVLTDFGLATFGAGVDGPDPRLGSPSFIAPERLRAADAGAASDLWSFGATLYAAVEGRTPFARADAGTALRALLDEPPDPPVRAGAMAPLLLDLLVKDPAERPGAAEVDARLRAIVSGPAELDARLRGIVSGPAGARPDGAAVGEAPPRTRRVRLVLAGTAALLTAAGLIVIGQRSDERARTVTPAAMMSEALAAPPRIGACGPGTPAPVTAADRNVPTRLPAGWVWFRDPSGFALALPAGWRRAVTGNDVCFSDPQGRRAFTVTMSPVVTRRPLAYWQGRERADLAAGSLPGYARISMGVLLLRDGGADWEYTWRPDSDTVRHERRVLLAVGDGRSYLLRWAVTDADWPASRALQRHLVDLFASAR